ncbi:MAG: formyltetrahydrofolate deformylase [Thermodesulfobacteriota bacterium]
MPEPLATTARLLITCPDQPGIVAAVTGFLYAHGANITALDQHTTDPEGGAFFMRLEFQTPHLDLSRSALESAFAAEVAERFAMRWRIAYAADRKKTAILVSRHEHGLLDLLWGWRRGEIYTDISMVISNHPDWQEAVESFGVPFYHLPVSKTNKPQTEQRMRAILQGQADLIVLARYMQILSPDFVAAFPQRIINIHHSFLPAFAGADPYRQAAERGVKLIGATAHYVTAELDAGPIIEQDVIRVSHRHSTADLKALGRDIERRVLSRAVQWHLEDKIIPYANKTVVFA